MIRAYGDYDGFDQRAKGLYTVYAYAYDNDDDDDGGDDDDDDDDD
eukprot:CAMPEP_0119344822 /NCGR_PEP_ID=MMETSP1333-20130426/107169_1 /TAXON_ID=418940 /ORGANISM="Scyphosphaera apsteinii, Strain RCC1455" /LENGTH=44 /DNA_ID= /DNA_START= /DNA_END= /DNA_ORIENTATION=